ncbi:hypothetical protein DC363_15235 [Thalassorhabdomicrobium marinisediminis]|uniref:Uncharacterized protein n=1 Tax=Thalassorhabdomicrobium marinisediminis TaxID=2170577 RepID=A0A2T7FT67_9RHOB|nr:hypothetical protein DC363_15235 [Thalassorhabdomicrobium marinisediminis]
MEVMLSIRFTEQPLQSMFKKIVHVRNAKMFKRLFRTARQTSPTSDTLSAYLRRDIGLPSDHDGPAPWPLWPTLGR